jgi:pimeloyl-ACP methyl ester carboxylesterase
LLENVAGEIMSGVGRRGFLQLSAAATAAIGAVGQAAPAVAATRNKTFLLVHGAWHGSFCWAEVAPRLSAAGHRVVAIDLPGHGIHALFPKSYFKKGQVGFDTEPTPLKGITLDVVAQVVVEALHDLQGPVKPVLVGHSMGGTVITRAAELAPELIGRLIYLTAFMPTKTGSPAGLYQLPESQIAGRPDLAVGDPGKIGAVRFNPRGDIDYLRRLHNVYYGDVPFERFLPYAVALSPDLPNGIWEGKTHVTAGRWGSIARTYIHCTDDRAIPPALQLKMIADADELTPGNRTHVVKLKASHSPFVSKVNELAALLQAT